MSILVEDNASTFAAVARLYLIGLDRDADNNGLAYWAEQLDGGNASLDDIGDAFASTREFNKVFDADLSDEEFVCALYETSFSREADDDGKAFWVLQLAEGASRGEVLAAFARSGEAADTLDVVGDAGLTIDDFVPSAFQYGVASGDPASDSVVLWTHARPVGAEDGTPVTVAWEVSTTEDFTNVVASGSGTTSSETDYTFKAIPEGLAAGETYYYRFTVDGETSATGTTRTLPEGGLDLLTLAVFSCVNYPAGFFNAYAEAVENGFDFSVQLGDYIYEYGIGEYATENAEELGRVPSPLNEILALDDYNARYAQYTSDTDLQALRAAAPMIMMWDDHETANDSWETGAENHDPATEGDWFERRDDALEAYFNWNPLREPESGDLRDHDKSYDFGDLATLHMMETRLQARDQTRSDTITALTTKAIIYALNPAAFEEDLSAFPELVPDGVDITDPDQLAALAADQAFVTELGLAVLLAEAADPERDMLGDEQMAELLTRIDESEATWQILGSQTLINRMELPAPLLTDLSTLDAYAAIAVKLATGETLTPEEEALLNAPRIPYNLDSWDGYQAEQNEIAQALIDGDKNAVVISGDTHNAWYSSFSNDEGELAAMHFGGPGVTSPGLEAIFADIPPEDVAALFVAFIDSLLYANTSDRGYLQVSVTPDAVSTDYVFVDTIE
ncbi:MAG: alkaline phosphatase D family protein, partial [Pseudomonadota bacterium]